MVNDLDRFFEETTIANKENEKKMNMKSLNTNSKIMPAETVYK